ncbi:D-amino acid dehydrogenase [Streptomyces tendae]
MSSPPLASRSPGTSPAPDVLVVGGGVVGLVTAWRAAQRGLSTGLVDPQPGGGAAQVAAGMLAAVTELHYGEGTLLALNLASARRYPAFAAELADRTGHDLGYRRCGTLAVALDADDRAHLRELHALQQRSGLESEWLSGRECRRLEPMLAPGVRGGLRVDGDHQIDPRRLAGALLAACEHAGVVFHRTWAERLPSGAGTARRCRHLGRHRAGGRAGGARRGQSERAAGGRAGGGAAAGAAGEGAGAAADDAGPPRPLLTGRCARWCAAAPSTWCRARAVSWWSARPARSWAGTRRSPRAACTSCCATPTSWCRASRSCRSRTTAGLRPGSPDNAPLLGPTGLDGLLLATGHHRNGVLLTPVTGDAMARVLTTGELPDEARAVHPAALRRRPGLAGPSAPRNERPRTPGDRHRQRRAPPVAARHGPGRASWVAHRGALRGGRRPQRNRRPARAVARHRPGRRRPRGGPHRRRKEADHGRRSPSSSAVRTVRRPG